MRQQEHARDFPDAAFEFTVLDRAAPGIELDRVEEYWIRKLGGPTNKGNPDGSLSNKRHQMSDTRYVEAGGKPLVTAEKVSTLKDGDVFSVALGDGTAAVGQIVASYRASYYVVLFDFVAPEDEIRSKISDALQSKPLFGGLTFDALFRPGRWNVLENRAVDSKRYLPAYKTGTSDLGNLKVEDFKAERSRAVSDPDAENFPLRKTSAPIIFERAMKAHLGLEPWHPAFDGVRLGDVITSAELFGD